MTVNVTSKGGETLDQSAAAVVLIASSCVYVWRMGKVLWQRQQSAHREREWTQSGQVRRSETPAACSTWVPRPASRCAAWPNFPWLAFFFVLVLFWFFFLPANANKWANLTDSKNALLAAPTVSRWEFSRIPCSLALESTPACPRRLLISAPTSLTSCLSARRVHVSCEPWFDSRPTPPNTHR